MRDKVREAGEGRLDGDAGGAGEDFAVVREPASGGEADFATLCTLLDLRRDYEEVAHDKLILDRRIAVSRERILHRPQHWLAALRAFARQREVLDSITRGLSNDDIATMLAISKVRVKQHLAALYEKLGAANRAEAVAIALRRQLLKH